MSQIRVKQSEKRDLIIKEAAKLFKEKGYKAASMRELASVIGIEAASLYNHIRSKADLLSSICFNVAGKYDTHLEVVENEAADAIIKVEKLLRFHVKEMIDNYEEVYVTDHEWRKMDDPELTEYRTMRRNYRKRFTAIVQQGIDVGRIRAIDANTAVMIFINAIGAVDQWHRIIHKVEAKDLEDNIVGILIDGVKK